MALFIREFLQIIRRAGLPAAGLLVVSTLNDQWINSQLEVQLLSDAGPGIGVVALASASLLNSLILPTFATVCLFWGLGRFRGSRETLREFLVRVLNQSYIETLRSWGGALAWGLLLILPGLIRLAQLLYVPLVVSFLVPYSEGAKDALATSTRYANKRPFVLIAYVAFFILILPLVLTSLLDPWRSYVDHPIGGIFCTLTDLAVLVISVQMLFRIFDGLRKQFGDESVLPGESPPSAVAESAPPSVIHV